MRLKSAAWLRCVLATALFLSLLSTASDVAGALGLTGNFYSYGFKLAPGETSAGLEAYVIVINTDTTRARVSMYTEAPPGVNIVLPETDFTLEGGDLKRLDVVVEVSSSAILGEYTISVSAESYREGSGIQITGGGMQQATLKVVRKGLSALVIAGVAAGAVVLIALVFWLLTKKRHRTA